MSSAIWYHFNWSVIWRHLDRLIDGLILGLEIAVVSLLVGCLIGLVGAFGRLSRARWLSMPVAAYVETIRNVPLLLLAYISYYALPIIGIDFLSNTQSFILALSVYSGA
jgi:His/Glu/Gln/Arg/opine family amino acid ABC transporter permease subunit